MSQEIIEAVREIERDKGALNLARAKQRAAALDLDREFLEHSLAIVLGYVPPAE